MDVNVPRPRPMGITDLVDAGFWVYRQHFLTALGIVALLFVPMLLLQLAVTWIFGQAIATDILDLAFELPRFNPDTDSFSELPIGNMVAFYGVSILLALVQGIIVLPLINGSLAHAINQNYHGQQPAMLEAYKLGGWRIFSLIAGSLLVGILSFLLYMVPLGLFVGVAAFMGAAVGAAGDEAGAVLGLLLLVVFFFGLIVVLLLAALISLCFAFVIPVIVVERRDPIAAIGRSWRLVTSVFWRVLGVAVMLFLLSLIFQLMAATLSGFVAAMFNQIDQFTISQTLNLLITYIIDMLLIPLFMITYTLLYFDTRIRKEGYDLQMQMQRAAPSPAPSSTYAHA
jgi:hypothetical protein